MSWVVPPPCLDGGTFTFPYEVLHVSISSCTPEYDDILPALVLMGRRCRRLQTCRAALAQGLLQNAMLSTVNLPNVMRATYIYSGWPSVVPVE